MYLTARAKTDEGRSMTTKVYEAFRYADKSSTPALNDVEAKITANFTVLSDAVDRGDDDMTQSVGDQLLTLIAERESLAKSFK